MKAKMINGKRFLFRGRHRLLSATNKQVDSLRRSGRNVRVIEKDGMYHVWATSMFG